MLHIKFYGPKRDSYNYHLFQKPLLSNLFQRNGLIFLKVSKPLQRDIIFNNLAPNTSWYPTYNFEKMKFSETFSKSRIVLRTDRSCSF